MPENYNFGGGSTATVLSPAFLAALLITILLILLVPRKHVLLPFLAAVFLIPMGQVVVIGGIHLVVLRLLLPFAWLRVWMLRHSSRLSLVAGGLTLGDKVFSLWTITFAVAFVMHYPEAQAVINRVGILYDSLGTYFLLRYFIRSERDIHGTIKVLAGVVAVIAPLMMYERATQVNLLGVLGGVRITPEMREGIARAQGPFQHSLLAGTFAATLLPLFAWLWIKGRSRVVAGAGLAAATVATVASWGSTQILAFAAAVGAICAWPVRRNLRLVRWGLASMLIGLQLVMNSSVWWIIARVGVMEGSSSYHRAWIIDQFMRHVGDWWLVGDSHYEQWGWQTWDTCNDYIQNGVRGGLATLVLFIAISVVGFKLLGKARAFYAGKGRHEWLPWLLGCALFAHLMAFFGVSYFDQTRVSWFVLLAMIPAATALPRKLPASLAPSENPRRYSAGVGLPAVEPVSMAGLQHRRG